VQPPENFVEARELNCSIEGDPSNNSALPNYNPSNGGQAHGGDFKGIEQKIEHIKALGATAIWMSPVVKNANGDYHGYAATDFYQPNPRMGTLADLQHMVSEAHKRHLPGHGSGCGANPRRPGRTALPEAENFAPLIPPRPSSRSPDTFSCETTPLRRYLDAAKSAGPAGFQKFHHERNGSHNDQCAGGR
jgi:hypothetical protein